MSTPLAPTQDTHRTAGMWMIFFALAYATQGFAQTTGILLQPINYFYKTGHGYTADQLAGVLFFVGLPWFFKPIYGLLADFIPLFGYRRRSYILLSTIVAFFAFTLVLGIDDPKLLLIALLMTALCTAVGDVMVDALMVEHGKFFNKIKQYQSIQWMAVSVLGILAALGGGWIAQYARDAAEPGKEAETAHLAIQIGAVIAALGPLMLLIATLWIVREKKSKIDMQGVSETAKGFREALKSKPLLAVILFFIAFWFQPGTSASMYMHATQTLPINEQQYGNSDAWSKAGYLVSTVLFMFVLAPRFSTRKLAILSIFLYSGTNFAYLFLEGPKTLNALGFSFGVCYMITLLTLLSLAAEVCPRRVEAFVFAFLMGLMNFVRMGTDWVGGKIYVELQGVYSGETTEGFFTLLDGMKYPINPLIVISSSVTLLALLFVPLLPKHEKADVDMPAEAGTQ